MSTVPLAANDKSAWIRDLVYLAFPEGEARERVLFDLVKQFSKMDPEDPEWLRYKLSVVECRALENVARGLNDAAAEQARLRSVTREIADSPVVILCQYDRRRFPGSQIVTALLTHPIVILGDNVARNPYFVPPPTDAIGPRDIV